MGYSTTATVCSDALTMTDLVFFDLLIFTKQRAKYKLWNQKKIQFYTTTQEDCTKNTYL
jgi:hypothetical protein